ncbi:flagellar protein [Nitrococcus mobilis Nb-231]|uniref:Flagellar protein n=2 Tax=Nitrococcus mobilis TaxID=35797 RepID=A4BUE1_9GAMM|nr:flagellar protein [Nitrococcus mobilis Nb-231]
MMPSNALQLRRLDAPGSTATVTGTPPVEDRFLTALAAQIEQETGRRVDPQTLAAWLKEHSDDYPAIAPGGLLPLLAGLVDRSVALGSTTSVAAGRPDPSALMRLLSTAAGGPVRGVDEQAARLLAALRAGGDAMQSAQQGSDAESNEPAAFQSVLQGAVAPLPAGLSSTENRAGLPTLQVSTPVTQAGFAAAVGERMQWMVRNEVHHARLLLNPPGLGPLDIAVTLQADQLSVVLNAHHALTREALAADVPRLRGLLADAGFGAVDVNVSQDHGGGNYPPPGAAPDELIPASVSGVPESLESVQGEGPLRLGRSLVDHYA